TAARMDVGLDQPRPYRIDAHPLRRELLGEPGGQRVDGALRSGIVHIFERRAEPGRRRGQKDDRSATTEAACTFPGAEISAQYIDLEDAPQPLAAHLGESEGWRHDAGIDDNARKRAERFFSRVEHREDVGLDRYVALDEDRLSARLAHFA